MGKLETLIRVSNDKFYVGGGYKVTKVNNPLQNLMKVVNHPSKAFPMFKTNYVEREFLPRIHPTTCSISDTEANQIRTIIKLLYHTPINIYVALFSDNVDVSNQTLIKTFIREHTTSFVLNVNPLTFTWTTEPLTVAFQSLEDAAHTLPLEDGVAYKLVLYASRVGDTAPTKYDAWKVVPFLKNDFTPPELHRFTVDLINDIGN